MFCPKCGTQNNDNSRFCASCGLDLNSVKSGGQLPPSGYPAPQQPPAYQQPPEYQQPPVYQQPYQPPVQQVTVLQQPNQGGFPGGIMPQVASHMVWAIISLIFFFWPTGIPAVVYASRVNNRLAMGDYYGAQSASRSAKTWCWVSFGIAIAAWVIVIIVYIVAWRTATNFYY